MTPAGRVSPAPAFRFPQPQEPSPQLWLWVGWGGVGLGWCGGGGGWGHLAFTSWCMPSTIQTHRYDASIYQSTRMNNITQGYDILKKHVTVYTHMYHIIQVFNIFRSHFGSRLQSGVLTFGYPQSIGLGTAVWSRAGGSWDIYRPWIKPFGASWLTITAHHNCSIAP